MRIMLFAHLKAIAGRETLEVQLPPQFSLAELWEGIIAVCPALAVQKNTVRITQNCEFANAQTQFAQTDEIALIPPVSGG